MTNQEFKNAFFEVAKKNGFSKAYRGVYKDNVDTWVVLHLQKSNYGNLYYCRYGIYIKGAFGMCQTITKDMLQDSLGHLGFDEPMWAKEIFNLENNMSDEKRLEQMELFFKSHVIPTSESVSKLEEIYELYQSRTLFLLPTVLKEIENLMPTALKSAMNKPNSNWGRMRLKPCIDFLKKHIPKFS